MEFLFRPRSSGKRQVKPSQDIAYLEEQIAANDESSDDSEFQLGNSEKENGEDEDEEEDEEDNSSSESSNSSDDEEESDDDNTGLKTDELLKLAKDSAAQVASSAPRGKGAQTKICGCCLGQASNDANEIVECDGCGVSVHEGCYGVGESLSVASEISEASTEPWFCEPCRAGLEAGQPPMCELCPGMGGLYKQTDVGRWVHLVCALYVPGVAFTDPDNLTNVTIFEMNYASWGRRPCSLCEDVRMARTGATIGCDAGLCKIHFHVTCGQAQGLLSEPSYHDSHDPYLAHCKIHTGKAVIRRRRKSYLANLLQIERRLAVIRARERPCDDRDKGHSAVLESEDQRILRKLGKHQQSFRKQRLQRHDPWIPTQKLPRALTTSASAIRKLERMGEMRGISVARQRLEERHAISVMEAKKKWHVGANFSVEFVAYFFDRRNRIDDFRSSLSDQLSIQASLRDKEMLARPKFDLLSRRHEASTENNEAARKKVKAFRQALLALAPTKMLPEHASLKPIVKPLEIVTPNVKAKATVWATNSFGEKSGMSLKTCGICKQTKDQHLLVHCDTCKLHYHLGCLTPPLTRMPKKSKLYGWQCSECDKGSSSSGEELTTANMNAPRRRRLAAAKARAVTSRHASDDSDGFFDDSWIKREVSHGGNNVTTSKQDQPVDEEAKRNLLIATAATTSSSPSTAQKEERRRQRRAEREKRRAERKKKRKEKKRLKREMEQQEAGGNEEDNDCEIIEHEDGQVIVNIKPKPLKLKIRTNHHNSAASQSADSPVKNKRKSVGNPTENGFDESSHVKSGDQSAPKRQKRHSANARDVRTRCDKCGREGNNDNLVRCDICLKCFHFSCLMPPLKKSPKVAGYGWHCSECDSDYDTDWHLD